MSRTTWKQRLASFAGHVQAMYTDITIMPDDELRALVAACKRATSTNCGWSTFRAARVIEAEAVNEWQGRRRKRRKRSAQPAKGD